MYPIKNITTAGIRKLSLYLKGSWYIRPTTKGKSIIAANSIFNLAIELKINFLFILPPKYHQYLQRLSF